MGSSHLFFEYWLSFLSQAIALVLQYRVFTVLPLPIGLQPVFDGFDSSFDKIRDSSNGRQFRAKSLYCTKSREGFDTQRRNAKALAVVARRA